MFALHEEGNSQKIRSHQEYSCYIHDNRQYHYVCLECNCSLCEICKSTHSTEHKVIFLQEFYNLKKNEFKNQFKLPPCSEKEISQELDKSNEDLKDEIKDLMNNYGITTEDLSNFGKILTKIYSKKLLNKEFPFEMLI